MEGCRLLRLRAKTNCFNEPLSSIKMQKMSNNYQILNRDFDPLSYLNTLT
jgi:hypothetical protein